MGIGARSVTSRARALLRGHPAETVLTALAGIYFGFALSPSSYAYPLKIFFGVRDTRTWFGEARVERWDEWAVQTPYIQAVVRTGYGTRNTTSFYGETFHNLLSLPARDWGLAFRPLQWGYLVLPPAWGFSLYWTLAAWLFLVGWIVLLRRFGLRYWVAVACALAMFLNPYTQAWWTALGPLLAFLPAFCYAFVVRMPLRWLVPLLAWWTASWTVSAAYLPGLIIGGFLAASLVLAFALRRDTLARTGLLAAGAVLGLGVGVVYLAPVLGALGDTVYPGHRVAPGGHVPFAQWLSQLVPFGVTHGWTTTLPAIMPEAVAMGSWLPVAALCLIDYRALRRHRAGAGTEPVGTLRPLLVTGAAFVLLTCWQLVPRLHVLGALLLWNRGPESRTLLASGVLLIVAAGWSLSRLPLRVTAPRIGAVLAAMLAASLLATIAVPAGTALWTRVRDDLSTALESVALLALAAGLVLAVRAATPGRGRRAGADRSARVTGTGAVTETGAAGAASVTGTGSAGTGSAGTGAARTGAARTGAGAAGVAGLVAMATVLPAAYLWLGYNPVQDSRVIFAPVRTPVTRALDKAAAGRSDHAVAGDFPGATLNGLGYRSVVHVLVLPQPATFARLFPDLDPAERNRLFNRYAEIYLTDKATPQLSGDGVVLLPRAAVRRFATFMPPPTPN